MPRDLEKKHAKNSSKQSQVAALASYSVEETRPVRFFNLQDDCKWVKKIEKDRQRKTK